MVHVLVVELGDQVGRVVLGHLEGFGVVAHVGVHLDRQLRLLGLDEARLRLLEVSSVDEVLRLVHLDRVHRRRLVLPRHLERVVEVPQVLVHVHRLARLPRLDEVLLSLLVPLLVLQVARVLHVHVLQLVSSVLVRHLECLVEFIPV